MQRKIPLITGEIYHIFNKSISHYVIFNSSEEYERMLRTVCHYKGLETALRFSRSKQRDAQKKKISPEVSANNQPPAPPVEIIAYCLMPTHFHFVLKQLKENGITEFVGNVQNSYTKYFNLRHGRKGPLWEGRFKNVLVRDDKQLLHLTRYIHLNPTTANIIENPKEWNFSSFKEYISYYEDKENVCCFAQYLDISPAEYEAFVYDHISYQRELAIIKRLILE